MKEHMKYSFFDICMGVTSWVRKSQDKEQNIRELQTENLVLAKENAKLSERLHQVDMQRPFLAVDIVCITPAGLVLIERKWPPLGYALPGGHVDYNESCENAAHREIKEETGLDIAIIGCLGIYSDPRRDPRKHCVSAAYLAHSTGNPIAADDAKSIRIVKHFNHLTNKTIFNHNLCFDHATIIENAKVLAAQSANSDIKRFFFDHD